MRILRDRALVALFTLGLAATGATAGTITSIGSRGTIGSADAIEWSTLGAEFDAVTGGASTSGNAFTLSGAATFTLLSGSTYNADFLHADTILSVFDLSSGAIPGEVRIVFASPIRAGGAQVQINSFGTPFTVVVEAFGLGGVSFGTVNFNGSVNDPSLGDGSALFAGIASSATDIYELRFSTGTDGMGINDVSLAYTGDFGGGEVPEPASGLLMAAAGGCLLFFARRRGGR